MSDNITKALEKTYVNKYVFIISAGFLLLFAALTLIDLELVKKLVNVSMNFACDYFGPFWQVVAVVFFGVAIFLMVSPLGKVRLGGLETPETSFFSWVCIIICTVIAGGGVFFSAAEPVYHFLSVPPAYSNAYTAGSAPAIAPAMVFSFLHWGFLPWCLAGTLGGVVLMYATYHRGMPFQPRSLLYPMLGKKGVMGPLGTAVDITAILAVGAGAIGPIGFLGLQLAYTAEFLGGYPNNYMTQLIVIVIVALVYTLTAATPIYKGINYMSRFNIYLALFVLAFYILIGPGSFIVNSFLAGFGLYISDFLYVSLYRDGSSWPNFWTIFYWGWFMGYGSMMAVLIARISRGRSIREMMLGVAIIAPIATNMWFSVLGGGSIFYELSNPGSISGPLAESGMPAIFLSTIVQMPWKTLMIPATILLIVLFLVTTGAGITYSIAVSVTGKANPPKWSVLFWGLLTGVVAAVLIRVGDGGITALQTSMVVTAIPVTFYFVPLIWYAPKCARELLLEQERLGTFVPVLEKAALDELEEDTAKGRA